MMNNAHRDDGWKKLAVLMTNENNIQRKSYNKVSQMMSNKKVNWN